MNKIPKMVGSGIEAECYSQDNQEKYPLSAQQQQQQQQQDDQQNDMKITMMNLSHNQLEIVFQFLSFKEVMSMRGTCKNISYQVELYLYVWYVPRYFSTFELAAEENNVKQLSARSLVDSFSTIFDHRSLLALSQLSSSEEHQLDLVQPLINCYEIILPGIFIKNQQSAQNDCKYELHNQEQTILSEFHFHDNNNPLSEAQYSLLAHHLSKIQLPVITMKLRAAAMIARGFSQLAINHNLRNKLAESRNRIQQYHLLARILQNVPLPNKIVSQQQQQQQ